jgi:hypothetical protein
MTDEERDPAGATGAEGTTDQPADEAATEAVETPVAADEPEPAAEAGDEADADEADLADEGEPLDEEDEFEDEEGEPEEQDVAPVGAGAAAATGARRTPRGMPARKPAVEKTVSEQAVRVDDRASAIFVIGVVGMFVAIFVLALLFGYGSFFGNVFKGPTPAPTIEVTAAPSESAAASPSASASAAPSVSVAPSGSAVPSASPAASPSLAPSPSPSAS